VIIVTRKDITPEQIDHIRERVESYGLRTHLSRGEHRTVIGCIGDEALLRDVALLSIPGVESVTPVLTPYKLAAREFAADDYYTEGRRAEGRWLGRGAEARRGQLFGALGVRRGHRREERGDGEYDDSRGAREPRDWHPATLWPRTAARYWPIGQTW
jgi:hypothetical protein